MDCHFKLENDPSLVLPIIKERLPVASHMYNQIIKYDKLKEDLKFYTITCTTPDVWIVSVYKREDYGLNVSISAPLAISNGSQSISDSVKHCFSSTEILTWDDSIVFFSLQKPISKMIFQISVEIKKNNTEVNPCYLYLLEKDVAMHKLIKCPENVTVKRLGAEDASFISSSWQHAKPGTYEVVSKCVRASASAGVFVNGKCVSGCVTLGHGYLGSLITLKEHRGKGYAKLATLFTFREMAKDGCIPCSIVQIKNKVSVGLHEALSMTRVPEELDLLLVIKTEYE